jgi:hypothetical protein
MALCLPSFKLFHDTIDLVQKKESLKKKFKKEWDVDESVTKKRYFFVKSGNFSTMVEMSDGSYFSTSVGINT